MNRIVSAFAGLLILAAVVGIASSAFTVRQTQYALVLQLGEPVRVISTPGLHFKLPFVQDVRFFDNRVLTLDTEPFQVLSAERRPVFIDTYTRWQITDPLTFYETLQTPAQARDRLTTLTTSNLYDVVGDREFQALLSAERSEIMAAIQDDVNAQVSRLGIRVVDVRILRAELPDQIAQTVFERMRTERQTEAQETRSRGRAAANRIQSAADRDRTVTLANARRDAEIIRGEGDAERNRIFAESYGRDPDFFAFYRTMRAYDESLQSSDTRLVISPDSEFLRYFNDSEGGE